MWGPLTVSRHGGVLSYINTANIKPLDALDVEELSRAERVLRGQVMGMAALLRAHIPGFEKAAVTWSTVQVGVRRTRIIECEHDLSLDDILEARRFDDEVALYGFHDMAPKLMIRNGGAYGIPYRALLPKKIEGVLVAGPHDHDELRGPHVDAQHRLVHGAGAGGGHGGGPREPRRREPAAA